MEEPKTALIFAGQLTQYPGMGTELLGIPAAEDVFKKAEGVVKNEALAMCLDGDSPEDMLYKIDNSHPAIFVNNHAFFMALKERIPDFMYHVTAGHSSGQCNAFVASGAVNFEDLLPLNQEMSGYTQQISDKVNGGLIAIIGKNVDDKNYLTKLEVIGLYPALFNSPRQTIVGFSRDGYSSSQRLNGTGKRYFDLPLEAPFHTRHMQEAEDLIREKTEFPTLNPNGYVPVVANSSGQLIPPHAILDEFCSIPSKPVRWYESIITMVEGGVNRFIVIGSDEKEFLKGLIEEITHDTEILVVKNKGTLEETVRKLAG